MFQEQPCSTRNKKVFFSSYVTNEKMIEYNSNFEKICFVLNLDDI